MKKILVLFLSLLTFSCAISKKEPVKIDLSKFEFFYIQNSDNLNFYFILNPVINQLKDSLTVEKIKLAFSSKTSNNKYEINLENVFSSIYQTTETSYQQIKIFYGVVNEIDLNGDNPENITTEAIALQGKNKFARKDNLSALKLKPNYSKLEFLKLYPGIKEIGDDNLKIDLFAIRVVPHSGEYLPSSEQFRVELYNYNTGKTINSSEGRNFLQVLTEVEPRIVGEYKIFSTQIEFPKKPSILERYLIKNIIPAKPNNYTVEINYWKNK